MRVLLVHNFYQQYGGEDGSALAEKKLLEDHGDEVSFYTRHSDEIKQYSALQKGLFFPRTVYSSRTCREVRQLVEQQRPQIACVNNAFPLISPSLYHELHALKVPTVQVLRDFRFLCPNGWFYTQGQICERCKEGNYLHAVRYKCFRDSYVLSGLYALTIGLHRQLGVMDKITAYIAATEFVRQKLLEVGIPEGRVFVKPNFVDPQEVAPNFAAGSYVLFLGRLSSEKGIWNLVRAFERLKDVRLKIAGTGPLEGPLKTYVTERGIHNVEFEGFTSGAAKWTLLKNCLFSVIPSTWYETFGKTIIESNAAGKCVIGSNLGGIPNVIENGKSGLLFEAGNEDDLVEKIQFLLDRPAETERMGRYGRQLAETKYSREENYRIMKSIFEAVAAGLA